MLLALISIFGLGTPTALDAERALHRDAQRMGQWTAFRAYTPKSVIGAAFEDAMRGKLKKYRESRLIEPVAPVNVRTIDVPVPEVAQNGMVLPAN